MKVFNVYYCLKFLVSRKAQRRAANMAGFWLVYVGTIESFVRNVTGFRISPILGLLF